MNYSAKYRIKMNRNSTKINIFLTLLLEANLIIKEAESKDVNKVSRLESLGFRQVKQVVEVRPLLEKANLSKEQIELVNYYKREYPFQKFITEKQVKTICHKYNLVC